MTQAWQMSGTLSSRDERNGIVLPSMPGLLARNGLEETWGGPSSDPPVCLAAALLKCGMHKVGRQAGCRRKSRNACKLAQNFLYCTDLVDNEIGNTSLSEVVFPLQIGTF